MVNKPLPDNSATKRTIAPPPRGSGETRSADKPTIAAPPIKK